MQDADALRSLAESAKVTMFLPTLKGVLWSAADSLERQDALILELQGRLLKADEGDA